jgi:pimeloyl-ACP methyl ester carboxylesterase
MLENHTEFQKMPFDTQLFEATFKSGTLAGLTLGQGRLTLIQHGIPEIPNFLLPLASKLQGRRVILPWLPGLRLSKLAGDFNLSSAVQLMIDWIESQTETVDYIGFDWGGGIGWLLEARRSRHPVKNLGQVIVVACPFLPLIPELIRTNEEQAKRSAYIPYFLRPDFGDKVRSAEFVPLKGSLPAKFIAKHPEIIASAEFAWSNDDYIAPLQSYYRTLLQTDAWKSDFIDFKPTPDFTWIWPMKDEFFVPANFVAADALQVRTLIQEHGSHYEHLKNESELPALLAKVLNR